DPRHPRPGPGRGAGPPPGRGLPPDRDRGRRDRRAVPARAVRRPVGRRAAVVDAAAPVLRALPGDPGGGVLGDRADRRRRARPGHRVAGRGPAGGLTGRGGPAGHPVPAAVRADAVPAGRRRVRLGPAVLAGRRAAGPGVPGGVPARRRDPRADLRRAGGQAHRRRGHGDHRRRLVRPARHGRRRAAGRDRADRRAGRLRLRADADAAGGRRRRGVVRAAVPGGGGGVDGLRHRGLHDLRAAGGGGGRGDPDEPVLRGGPGVRPRAGALGRRRHGARGHAGGGAV
ncbi:MAG: Dihydroorotate dehydrogenase (NAD(+)), electron transfer subunit, partial [uncultured Corynebacteriales bacterium]